MLHGIDPEFGMVRAADRGELDRVDREKSAFSNKVRGAYLERVAMYHFRYKVIDASRPLDEIGCIFQVLLRI